MANQAGFAPVIASPRRWDVLAGIIAERGYRTFVEVGCKEGRTTAFVLANCPDVRVTAIDPWMVQLENEGIAGRETYEKWDFAKIEAEFWSNVGEHKARCTFMRNKSDEAAQHFAELGRRCDTSVDLVFVDALHDEASVRADIALWWPLVAPGGILAGHDFNHKWPGVQRAVASQFNLLDVGVAPDSVWFVVKPKPNGGSNVGNAEAAAA